MGNVDSNVRQGVCVHGGHVGEGEGGRVDNRLLIEQLLAISRVKTNLGPTNEWEMLTNLIYENL